MPAISKIRLCNIIYENGGKRYNDQIFHFDGQNSVLLLENGGGKTVLIQTVLQCIIPHISMADRKIKDTLYLDHGPAHVAIEWIINEQPRRYALTAVSLYSENNQLNSLKYTCEYGGSDDETIETIPFKVKVKGDQFRPATRGEISEYYQRTAKNNPFANIFTRVKDYGAYLENTFKIIPSEWRKIALINSGEGNVDEYFNRCKTTEQLLNNLLIPVVEEAVEGDNQVAFADTFRKQRDHFKKNRILQEKIQQSQGVKEEIDRYVGQYQVFDRQYKRTLAIKRKLKGFYQFVEEKYNETEKKKQDIYVRREELFKEEKSLQVQKLTYKLLLLEKDLCNKDKEIDLLESSIHTLETERNKWAKRRQNIQITKITQTAKGLNDNLLKLGEELELAQKDIPSRDLQQQLNENSSYIHGYFSYELELIKIELNKRHDYMRELDSKKDALKKQLELTKTKEQQIKDNKIKTEATLELIKKEMDAIYDNLFEEEIGCQIDEKLKDWQEDEKRIKENQRELEEALANWKDKIEQCQSELADKETYLQLKGSELQKVLDRKNEIEEKTKKLGDQIAYEGLSTFKPETIYTKEESIKALIHEKIDYLMDQRERMRQKELEYRNKVIYKEITHPFLINCVKELRQSVDYISLGQEYLIKLSESMQLEKRAVLERYPFFAITLVTNKKSKQTVIDFIEERKNEWSDPLILLSVEELNLIMEEDNGLNELNLHNTMITNNVIIPTLWYESLSDTFVQERQETLINQLTKTEKEIRILDKKWLELNTLEKEVGDFFEIYPYRHFVEVMNTIDSLDIEIEENKKSIQKSLEQLKEFEQTYAACLAEKEIYQSQRIELRDRIDKASRYEALYNHYLIRREEEEKLSTAIADRIYERKELENTFQALIQEQEIEQRNRSEFLYEERRIKDNSLYKEIQEAEVICSNQDLSVLVNERERLKQKLSGVNLSRESILGQIKEKKQLLAHYDEQLKRLMKESEFEIESIETFYENEEDQLFDRIVETKASIKELQRDLKKIEKDRWSKEAEKKLLTEELMESKEERFDFDCDIEYIPTRIKIFEKTVRDMKNVIQKDEDQLSKGLKEYNDLLTELKVKNGSSNFLLEEIHLLTKKEKETINPLNFMHQLFKELGGNQMLLDEKSEEVKKAKRSVSDYCRTQVADFRLKEAVIKGLMEKTDLEDLLIYQERMADIIQKTIQLANDDKRESDKELSTFLHHLITYVRRVIRELSILQSKTVIELDHKKKQIFIIDIPEYDEEEAKDALRAYINTMIELLDEEADLEEDNLLHLIEERLNVRNLIPVVLGGLPIKVKCRKVTNDLKINQAPMSWEFSNKWSGGEKWSKNMTLFLGILNYLAEKKQHLSANQKKNRTVILDNPFGKASSKHVLDPVFFIAEKLGFQIIALTAHAKGQFISDYFPVVYSLRLCQTGQENKRLMMGDRMLNYTYLKEKSPASINRLEEAKQLELFLND